MSFHYSDVGMVRT